MQAIDPEETDTFRRRFQHQHIYDPDRFHQAIEARLGRNLGPKKIGHSEKPQAETSDLLESRL